jgi:hypothetical protein
MKIVVVLVLAAVAYAQPTRISDNSFLIEEAYISPGIRQAWNFSSGAQMVGGLGFPVGLKGDVPDFAGLLYLSFVHSFSGN